MKFRIVPYYGKHRPQVFDEENNEYRDIASEIGCETIEEARELCRKENESWSKQLCMVES